ncbi:MAG: aldehyde oxidase and xanthine dehydrogenase family protein [Myxococcales bacterium]|nr:aldehyde oxidase and xanthine dehydrogenase family protein [Myxococcales bacterium]
MIGQPINRVEGSLKVTGQATYAYEEWGIGQPLYGFIVGATVGRGRIKRIDTKRAQQAPGVRLVMTHLDAPRQPKPDMTAFDSYQRSYPVLQGPDVHAFGEPVALVVAVTLEQARAAAALVEIEYQVLEGRFDLAAREADAFVPVSVNAGFAVDTSVGDFDAAFDSAPVKLDQRYTTPFCFSQPMEPHGCLAVWNGDAVTVHVPTQIVADARVRIAKTLGIDVQRVKVISRYVGGGFGSKLGVHAETILAVLAARQLAQPVKVTLARQQVFQLIGNRPASLQRVRLAADRDGRLIAFGHDVTSSGGSTGAYVEQTAVTGRGLYAAPNRETKHRAVLLDVPDGEDVRAPGEAPGLLAIESAVDELAHALGMDPIELRIKNEPERHPESGLPFSERRLVECYREGARRFGWDKRPKTPASVRDGQWLIGYGMSAAIRPHFQLATEARVRIGPDGIAVVQSDMTDIGTGTYTILTQIAAESLGLPIERVRVELGDSDFPRSAGSGGSWGATNSCGAVYAACRALLDKLVAKLRTDEQSPLREADLGSAVFANGRITAGNASEELTAAVTRNFPAGLDASGSIPDKWLDPDFALNSYGAHFAEIGVDVDTGEIRLRRMLGVFAAGRIFNAKTARSQLIGGMLWGVSAALHEEGVIDVRSGAFVNRDLAQYLVPVHADVPAVDAIILDGFDDKANALGAKGIGEVGICGAGAAVANAVFNATGVRVRDFPITLEQLLPALPHPHER